LEEPHANSIRRVPVHKGQQADSDTQTAASPGEPTSAHYGNRRAKHLDRCTVANNMKHQTNNTYLTPWQTTAMAHAQNSP